MNMFKRRRPDSADIRYIDPSDNRGLGSSIGAALRGLDPGTRVKFAFI
jgi:hypothetical protein